ncbi:MAG: PLDc_N domain-containing protein [Longispora sp.]|nr:PLDc_N domain-containing protein [Longispora sp. (in: high G+C Gram-positive bacteria)]
MARLYLLLLLVNVVLAVYCFIDCVVSPGREIRSMPKPAWLFVLLLFWPLAWIAWLAFGRAVAETGGDGAGTATGGRRLPHAPDDDLEFLRGLSTGGTSGGATGGTPGKPTGGPGGPGMPGGPGGNGGSGGSRPPQTPRPPSSPSTPKRGTSPPRDGNAEEQFRRWEEEMRRKAKGGDGENASESGSDVPGLDGGGGTRGHDETPDGVDEPKND